MTLGDQLIVDYWEKITTFSNLLANFQNAVLARTLVTRLLNGFPPQYEPIAMIICPKDPFLSFLQARSALVAKEQRLKRNRQKNHHTPIMYPRRRSFTLLISPNGPELLMVTIVVALPVAVTMVVVVSNLVTISMLPHNIKYPSTYG